MKLKPKSLAIFLTKRRRTLTLGSDWFIVISVYSRIRRSNYFGFGFTTLFHLIKKMPHNSGHFITKHFDAIGQLWFRASL